MPDAVLKTLREIARDNETFCECTVAAILTLTELARSSIRQMMNQFMQSARSALTKTYCKYCARPAVP